VTFGTLYRSEHERKLRSRFCKVEIVLDGYYITSSCKFPIVPKIMKVGWQ